MAKCFNCLRLCVRVCVRECVWANVCVCVCFGYVCVRVHICVSAPLCGRFKENQIVDHRSDTPHGFCRFYIFDLRMTATGGCENCQHCDDRQ